MARHVKTTQSQSWKQGWLFLLGHVFELQSRAVGVWAVVNETVSEAKSLWACKPPDSCLLDSLSEIGSEQPRDSITQANRQASTIDFGKRHQTRTSTLFHAEAKGLCR